MKEYQSILSELIKQKQNWRDLKTEISKFNVQATESTEKDSRAGKIFEVFTKYYFLTSPTDKDNYKNVWLFEETPLDVRNKLNLGNQDYGVDLVLQDNEDLFLVVQCKFRNDETSKLNWSADKIANLFAVCPKADGYIVFSNSIDLDSVSKTRHDRFTFFSIANLNEIESETFESIYTLLTENKLSERIFFEPKTHQEKAIQECVDFFEIEERGQLILPCGAGKTFTALWIKERLHSKNTLVLVPSLALLRQIKNEWAKQRKIVYQYLCVCSETDIDKDSEDTLVSHTYEVDTRVTTNSNHVKSFLTNSFENRVIFSTYHSLQVVADSIKGTGFEFDFIFCDEAHKTAGIGMNKFSLVHDNELIPSKRRLYATATPRIVKEIVKKKLGEDLMYAYDMNDPNIFGYEFYRMTFKEAIEENILVDYKIVAIGINDGELKDYIEQRRFIDSNISIDELANNYALEHIMNKYEANHGLTFHSRVKLAQEFANRHTQLFERTRAFSVSGEQPTSYRNLVLEEFKNAQRAIVSNARCLTEGVDVPAIDLVYFCDPKNSKVDIVQAVGRALRKKEGKKIGLVVVPIYHTRKDDVEKSISSGSFRNLLQVIRSLCDQDERLQDEINFLAYGKGKRQSTRIDFVSTNFIGEKDKILLEGFEDKLRKSLFDQIIDKTSNNWDVWFLRLKEFLDTNKVYPLEKDDSELYRWVAQQRTRKSSGILKNEEIRKLNEIDFIWDKQERKWNLMYSKLLDYAKENGFEPSKENSPELASWYRTQVNHLDAGKLREDRIPKISSVKFEGSSIQNKWIQTYNELVKYRQLNSDNWPNYDRNNPDSQESKLNIFCQTIRKRYRKNDLSDYWFEKMTIIDFNFEGKSDNWFRYYDSIKETLESSESISIERIGSNAYSWILRHKKMFEEGKLTDIQSKKIKDLNLNRYFETWEEKFTKIEDWVNENGKIPTKLAHSDFNSWLQSQRARFKKGTLTEEQIEKLRSISFDLEGLGNEKNEEKWVKYFDELKQFIIDNNRYPGPTNEKELYIWVQSQRAAKAGTLRNRNDLSDKRIELLNSIDFQWIGEKGGSGTEISWEENFEELITHIRPNGRLVLPANINGKQSLLYIWWRYQKSAFEKGLLSEDKIEAFKNAGVDLGNLINTPTEVGYTKWANKLYEIVEFIKQRGHYPKRGTDKVENNLYNSLSRTRRAFENHELSDNQLVLLKKIDIDLK